MTNSDNSTSRVTTQGDGDPTATTTFLADWLVVEFDAPLDSERSFPTNNEHDVDGESDGHRGHAQLNSGDTTGTVNCGLLVVRVRRNRSGARGWQVLIESAALPGDDVLWRRRRDDGQQTAHNEPHDSLGVDLATTAASTRSENPPSVERDHLGSAAAVPELLLQRPTHASRFRACEANVAHPRLEPNRPMRRPTRQGTAPPTASPTAGSETAPTYWSRQPATSESPTAVTVTTVKPRPNRRRHFPIAIAATSVLGFVCGAMTISAQTRPRTTTTLNTTAAATTLPQVTARPAPTTHLPTDVNIYDLAISGPSNTPASAETATEMGQAVHMASDALLIRLRAMAAAGILPDEEFWNEYVEESTTKQHTIDTLDPAQQTNATLNLEPRTGRS